MAEVGIMCSEGHEVFSGVSLLLEQDYGHRVDFIQPEKELGCDEISNYDILVPKKSREEVYRNLRKAEEEEVETVNSLVSSMTADHNVASMYHLGELDYEVPERVNGDWESIVEKPAFEAQMFHPRKDPGKLRENCITEEYIECSGIDYKVYIVDTGEEIFVSGVKTGSKLERNPEKREIFEPSDIGFSEEDAGEVLEEFFDADFLGIDFIENGEDYYAVDVNSAPSFRGLENVEEKLALAIHNRTE
jgi:glutathione synthase/RimK-type ligase-like ATP-grasp enzyme